MTLRTATTLVLALAAGLAAGCGADDETGKGIPPDAAERLRGQLTSIENRFRAGGGACGDITGGDDPNTRAVEQILASLPQDVDPDVRDALQQSFDRLFELTDDQCDEEKAQETETEEEPPPVTEETEAETETETETVPTETEPTETEEEPTEPEPVEPPAEPPGQQKQKDKGSKGGGVIVPGEDG